MSKRPHVPVRYIDRLNTICRKLTMIRYGIEDLDPEVGKILDGIERRIANATSALNRYGPDRERYIQHEEEGK